MGRGGGGETREDVAGQRGPTYAEVAAIAAEIERDYGVLVHFRVVPAHPGRRWAVSLCRVCAVANRARGAEADSVAVCVGFRGISGASTMPGAQLAALYELEERMTDPASPWERARYELA